MFKNDILFTGFYGHKNTGDDAFIEVSAWGAEKYWNKKDVLFLSKKEGLPITKKKIKGYPLSIPKSYSLQNKLLLANANYLISAGGSTIHSKMAVSNVKSKGVNLKQSCGKIKLGAIGVSIGPFQNVEDEKAVVEYLKKLDFLAVRDQASYEMVSQLELPYEPVNSFDLAALLPKIYQGKTKLKEDCDKKVIAVSVCPYESISKPKELIKEEQRNEMLCKLLSSLDKADNIHFKFLVINGSNRIGDLILTQQTIQRANIKSYEVVHYNKQTELMWDEVNNSDFVITTRLHAAIFSCFANVPFMLNEYHKKCSDFLETVGYKTSYRLNNSEYEIRSKTEQILSIINDKSYVPPEKKSQAMKAAEYNFTKVGLI